MKNINRNILWSTVFFEQLAQLGVKHVCISPGSRSTPLTLAAVSNKKLNCIKIIDERSSAFFATGLARTSGKPVALICTSGTATAEYYPAIIEAYQQRIPLIVCTADRPPELFSRGANQTINQKNLYANHIRYFADPGLPSVKVKKLESLRKIAEKAFVVSAVNNKGPVHINLPFEKPFEPENSTDSLKADLKISYRAMKDLAIKDDPSPASLSSVFSLMGKTARGIIIVGPDQYNKEFPKLITEVSRKSGYPIFADGASQLRFGKFSKQNILANFDALLRSKEFLKTFSPEIILHFGRTITSKGLEEFLEKSRAQKFMINEFGDWFDPSGNAKHAIAVKPFIFCTKFLRTGKVAHVDERLLWQHQLRQADTLAETKKQHHFSGAPLSLEPNVIINLLSLLPEKANILLSNSLPIRDFDFFTSTSQKEITIYHNRGASGIDGIISTALGITYSSKVPTYLVIGDLAFYYDLTSLLIAKQYKLPLTIIVVNNNGGGIFRFLPIAQHKEVFDEFFSMPTSLSFGKIVKEFGGNYSRIASPKKFRYSLQTTSERKNFSVIEIKTNSEESLKLRRSFWKEIDSLLIKRNAAK